MRWESHLVHIPECTYPHVSCITVLSVRLCTDQLTEHLKISRLSLTSSCDYNWKQTCKPDKYMHGQVHGHHMNSQPTSCTTKYKDIKNTQCVYFVGYIVAPIEGCRCNYISMAIINAGLGYAFNSNNGGCYNIPVWDNGFTVSATIKIIILMMEAMATCTFICFCKVIFY